MSLSKASSGGMASGCFICKSPEDDELLYGKFVGKWRIQVHYYCLLLTSNLVQNGESDDVGIFGFLQEDIRAEEARIRSQKCYLCKAPYANISCCAKKCFRTFHTVCGRQNGCLSHFVGTYQSWCDRHVELHEPVQHEPTDSCGICYEELGPWDKLESIRAPCCQNGWFHRRCVTQFAQSAGYFFKCPLCNNKDEFTQIIQTRGVYVPEKDAEWEMEPNAFGEQLERPSECDAEVCLCRFGRDYDTLNGKWDLRLCETCGSTCRHDLCMEVPTKNYVCTFCRPIVGDVPPAAVLALAEESRRAEAARRQSTSSDASGSTSGSSSIGHRGRNRRTQRLRSLSSSSRSSSASDVVVRKKSKRPLSSTDSDSGCELQDLIKKLPIRREARDKLLNGRIVVRLEKLSREQIKKLTTPLEPVTAADANRQPSSQSSEDKFDFNYRAKMNKQQRRKSVADLQCLREVIRSDTDTLTTDGKTDDASDNNGREIVPAKTPTRKTGSFAKQFKLRLAGSKTVTHSRKRIISSSESDPEPPAGKKSCPASAPPVNKSKSRIALFPPDDSENTCPNSPHKCPPVTATGDPPLASIASPTPSSFQQKPPVEVAKKSQTTLNSFFKKSPDAASGSGSGSSGGHDTSSSGNNNNNSAILSSASGDKSGRKKHPVGGSARKKLVELDRSQRNLLDYFNRC